MYIRRHMEECINRASKMFGAVIVTGARQVGKTTLLKTLNGDITYVTLDDPLLRQSAANEPATFLKDNPSPVIIDEIQYAPGVFPYIKMQIDTSKKKGCFYLTGSQQFHMMEKLSESLAGRIGICNLLGLSLREISGSGFNQPFIPKREYFEMRKKEMNAVGYDDFWINLHRGSMPELTANPDYDWRLFYSSYAKTYLERDVRALTQVGDELKFLNFMTVIAASTGQLLNIASLSRDVGISQPTVVRWLSILQASNIVYLLQPYHNNISKRSSKTPKIYFLDTGLAAYLTRWNTPDVLKTGNQAGAFFESYVVAEILKSYYNVGVLEPPLFFFRDKAQNEIDVLILENGTLYPLEIKKHADPSKNDIEAFSVLDKLPAVKRGPGGVICMYDSLASLSKDDTVIPISYI